MYFFCSGMHPISLQQPHMNQNVVQKRRGNIVIRLNKYIIILFGLWLLFLMCFSSCFSFYFLLAQCYAITKQQNIKCKLRSMVQKTFHHKIRDGCFLDVEAHENEINIHELLHLSIFFMSRYYTIYIFIQNIHIRLLNSWIG